MKKRHLWVRWWNGEYHLWQYKCAACGEIGYGVPA